MNPRCSHILCPGIRLSWQVNQLVDLMSAEKSTLLQKIASLEVTAFNVEYVIALKQVS